MCSLEKNGKMLNLFGLSKNKIKWFGGKIKEKKFYSQTKGKRIQHHQSSLTVNIERICLAGEKKEGTTRNTKITNRKAHW